MKIASEVSANEVLAASSPGLPPGPQNPPESMCEMKSAIMESLFGEGRRGCLGKVNTMPL